MKARSLGFKALLITTPLAVSLAIAPHGAAQHGADGSAADRVEAAAAKPTPRTAAGHPDLSGYWTDVNAFGGCFLGAPIEASEDGQVLELTELDVLFLCERAVGFYEQRVQNPNLRPSYKPEYQAQHQELLTGPHYLDPAFRCLPVGVPRLGPPQEIVQTPTAVYFLYATQQRNYYRVIPTDGRPHDESVDYMSMGDSIGRWEGDTLVVDVTMLSDETWLDGDGTFHSKDTHVVERFTRKGDSILYEVSVEDPYFTEPWTPDPRNLVPGAAGQHVKEDYPCIEASTPNMTNDDRH